MLTNPTPSIGFLTYDISKHMRQTFDLKARGLGVTRQQWRTLFFLARHDGPTQTELADSLEVERISVGRMVDRLVDNGLVERRADPLDRRVWRLHLLPAAYEIVNSLNAIGHNLEREALADMPEDKQRDLALLLDQLLQGLKRVRCNLEEQKDVA
jgi:MarR family transcriptional regulator, transcriptional regulator for hemolysin